MLRSKTIRVAALAALVLATTADAAHAGGWRWGRRGRAGRGAAMRQGYTFGEYPSASATYQGVAWQGCGVGYAVQPAATAQATTASDPDSFLAWINGVRRSAGLPGVGWDDNLAAWAARNSAAGFDHNVRYARRQDVGWGSFEAVCAGWLASPAHLSAILDPSVSRVGLACVGAVWTLELD